MRTPVTPTCPGRVSRGCIALAIALAACAWAREGHAQAPAEIAVAKQWFSDGLKREETGNWSEALDLFRRAASVKKTPNIVFHVGLCESRTGALVEALVDLDRARELAVAANAPDVESAAVAELADVKARVPTLQIDPPEGSTPTRVLLDGTALAVATLHTALPANPGVHEVKVDYPSGSFEKRVTLKERDAVKLAAAPPRSAAPPPVAPPPAATTATTATEPAPAAAPRDTSRSMTPWIFLGGGAAAAIAGGVFWGLRGGEISALDAGCSAQRTACDPALRSHEDRGKLDTALSIVFVGVGAASIATGVVLLVRGGGAKGSSPAAGEVRVAPTFGGASLLGAF